MVSFKNTWGRFIINIGSSKKATYPVPSYPGRAWLLEAEPVDSWARVWAAHAQFSMSLSLIRVEIFHLTVRQVRLTIHSELGNFVEISRSRPRLIFSFLLSSTRLPFLRQFNLRGIWSVSPNLNKGARHPDSFYPSPFLPAHSTLNLITARIRLKLIELRVAVTLFVWHELSLDIHVDKIRRNSRPCLWTERVWRLNGTVSVWLYNTHVIWGHPKKVFKYHCGRPLCKDPSN